MSIRNRISLSLLISTISFFLHAQTEILIVGTMHELPEGMPDNYARVLKIVDGWNPDVICTEFRLPSDTLSLTKLYGESYLRKKDSIAREWNVDLRNPIDQITKLSQSVESNDNLHERMQLRNLYHLTHDLGNARYQAYQIIKKFDSLSENEKLDFKSKFPMFQKMLDYEIASKNDEFAKLEFPLAYKKGIRYLYPTDDQSLRDLYHDAWDKANSELEGEQIFKDHVKFVKEFKASMGKDLQEGNALLTVNSRKSQDLLYQLEYSFIPAGISMHKDLMNFYYMDRNTKMAMHILDVARSHPRKKIVVFYGVSHVPFINKILRAESNHRILTLPDLE